MKLRGMAYHIIMSLLVCTVFFTLPITAFGADKPHSALEGANETDVFVIYVVIGIVLLLIGVRLFFTVIRPFLDTKKYIEVELGRSEGKEYDFWKRELRNHYIRHIPIFGRLIRRLMR